MNINVYKPNVLPEKLSVTVEGYCNHADYTIESETEDIVVVDGADQTIQVDYKICNKCGCSKRADFPEYEDWIGIEALPNPHIYNSRELVLR